MPDEVYTETERLRIALIAMRELARVSHYGDGWYAGLAGLDAEAIFDQAKEALGE